MIYKYGATGAAPYGDPFTVIDSWADWLKKVWVDALTASGYSAQQPAWVPAYDSGSVSWPGNDGTMQRADLNPLEFPTKATVDTLALRFAIDGKPLQVLEVPFLGLGPVMSAAVQRLLMFPNGATLPAFQLANYFTNNPEDKSGAAQALCLLLIAKVYPAHVAA